MPIKRVQIVTLDEANDTALLCNLPGEPAATFNLTLSQPTTEGVCRPTSSGLNGTIDLNAEASGNLLTYSDGDTVQIQWSGTVFVKHVAFSAG